MRFMNRMVRASVQTYKRCMKRMFPIVLGMVPLNWLPLRVLQKARTGVTIRAW